MAFQEQASAQEKAPKVTATVTVYTKSNGILSKRISMGADGKPFPDGSECRMARGTAVNTAVASVREFADLINGMKPEQALSLGRIITGVGAAEPYKSVYCVARGMLNSNDPATIARTQDFIRYVAGEPGFMLIDFDQKGMPPEVRARLATMGGVWPAILNVCPALAGAACAGRHSTSSGLSNKLTGEQYPSSGGLHVYPAVVDSSDIPRALKVLHQRMWLAGMGWIFLGKTGQMLERSLVDATVDGPERLIFEGEPVLEFPLAQDAASRRATYYEGHVVDTRIALPDLDPGEQVEYRHLLAEAKATLKNEADAKAKKADEEMAERVSKKTGKTFAEAYEQIKKRHRGVLMPDCELEFDDPALGVKTVADVLSNPEIYIGETLADPLEGVAYGRTKAMIMGSPATGLVVHSFAHGHGLYQLKMDFAVVRAIIDQAPAGRVFETFFKAADQAELSAEEYALLKAIACERAHLGARVFNQAEKEHQKKKAGARSEEQASSDPRPSMQAPYPKDELNPYIEALDAILAGVKEPVGAPFRNAEGRPARIEMRALPGLHTLVSERAAEASDGYVAAPQQHVIAAVDAAQLALDVQPFARLWEMRENKETGEEYEADVRLPADFALAYMGWHLSRVPRVSGVSSLPVVPPNGSIVKTNGLHRELGAIFTIDQNLLECLPGSVVSIEEGKEAYEFLTKTWLVDVATDAWGKAVLIAMALTVIERLLLSERPFFVVSAGNRETGKTTTMHMLSHAVRGRAAPAAAWSPNEEERRKQIFALCMEGADFVVFDNIPRGAQITSATLDKALTSPEVSDRVLGESRMGVAPAATVFAATGNNITPHGDTASRTYVARIDVPSARPAGRDFKHPDPIGWTLSHRKQILTALYKILMLGREEPGVNDCRFKLWWKLVGHPVMLVSDQDLSKASSRAEAEDGETVAFVSLLTALNVKLGAKARAGFTAGDVAKLLEPAEHYGAAGHDEAVELKANLEIASGGRAFPPAGLNAIRVGLKLKALDGRRALYDGLTVSLEAGTEHGQATYKITVVVEKTI